MNHAETQTQVDILELNQRILGNFCEEETQLPSYERKLENLTWIAHHAPSKKDRVAAEERVRELEARIARIRACEDRHYYLARVQPLLRMYKKLLRTPVYIDFMTGQQRGNDSLCHIFHQYIPLAREFLDLPSVLVPRCDEPRTNTSTVTVPPLRCQQCQGSSFRDAGQGIVECQRCGFRQETFEANSFRDAERINTARYTYARLVHFRDCVKRYQGIQKKRIPQRLYTILSHDITRYDLSSDKLTKDHIYQFLRENSLSDFYEDINLIYSRLTKTPAPNIRHLEKKLYEMFCTIEPIYDELKPDDRKNIFKSQYLLYQFLRQLRYPCHEEDFSILKTRTRLVEYDELYARICQILSSRGDTQWSFTPTVS